MSDKVAAFMLVTNGVDGRDKERIEFCSLSEEERDGHYELLGDNNKWYTKVDRVISLSQVTNQMISKLNGVDKMILQHTLNFYYWDGDSLSFPYGDTNCTCLETAKEGRIKSPKKSTLFPNKKHA